MLEVVLGERFVTKQKYAIPKVLVKIADDVPCV